MDNFIAHLGAAYIRDFSNLHENAIDKVHRITRQERLYWLLTFHFKEGKNIIETNYDYIVDNSFHDYMINLYKNLWYVYMNVFHEIRIVYASVRIISTTPKKAPWSFWKSARYCGEGFRFNIFSVCRNSQSLTADNQQS